MDEAGRRHAIRADAEGEVETGHCPDDPLSDIEDVLGQVRSWPDIREPRPGIFYIRQTAFLHFHIKNGRRWADARAGTLWGGEIEVPLGIGTAGKAEMTRSLRERYDATHRAVVRPKARTETPVIRTRGVRRGRPREEPPEEEGGPES